MPAGHLLSHIQKYRVCTVFRYIDCSLEVMRTSCLPSVSLSRGNVQGNFLSFSLRSFHLDTAFGRVEVGKTVIVPQKSVSLARKQERNRYLSIYLSESSCEASYVEVSVLELSQTIEIFVGRGVDHKLGFLGRFALDRAGLKFMGKRREHNHASAVRNFDASATVVSHQCQPLESEGGNISL